MPQATTAHSFYPSQPAATGTQSPPGSRRQLGLGSRGNFAGSTMALETHAAPRPPLVCLRPRQSPLRPLCPHRSLQGLHLCLAPSWYPYSLSCEATSMWQARSRCTCSCRRGRTLRWAASHSRFSIVTLHCVARDLARRSMGSFCRSFSRTAAHTALVGCATTRAPVGGANVTLP